MNLRRRVATVLIGMLSVICVTAGTAHAGTGDPDRIAVGQVLQLP
jgi:hypothetical protein